jgi:hypothetical protein
MLVLPLKGVMRGIAVLKLGARRGPAKEAQTLFEEISPELTPSLDGRCAPRHVSGASTD